MDVWALATQYGPFGLCLIALATGAKRAWVFGWVYDDMRSERNEWRKLALSGTTIAEQATGIPS